MDLITNGYQQYPSNIISTGQMYNYSPVYQNNQTPPYYDSGVNSYYSGGYQPGQAYNNYDYYQQPYQQYGYNNQYNYQQYGGYNNYSYQQPYNNYGYNNQYNYQQPYQQYGYNNYSYNNYGYNQPYSGYNCYGYGVSPSSMDKIAKDQIDRLKRKLKIANTYLGNNLTDEQLDEMVNPKNPVNEIPKERLEQIKEENEMYRINQLFVNQQQYIDPILIRMQRDSMKFHETYDSMNMIEFLNDGLPVLMQEQWERENLDYNFRKNLKSSYNSSSYNDLLSFHASSNPFISKLLSDSKYDNNIDDMEIGLPAAFDAARRRQQLLEGKVPSFISSDEVQEGRKKFFDGIFAQIQKKNGGG